MVKSLHDFDPKKEAAWQSFQDEVNMLNDGRWNPYTGIIQGVNDVDAPDAEQLLNGRIRFDRAFWERNREGEQWLLEPVLALGRSHALYAPAKAGKSLLALEIAAALATGRQVLDQTPTRPYTVLYVDFEMTEDDLYERLTDLGYGPSDDLSRLHYHLHPTIPPLDTAHGGAQLVDHAEAIKAELAVVDTVARSIGGEENSADTIISLARYTFTPLKARGITSLRVDHAGKDLGRGQRGTSAKNDDVDIVWQLTIADGNAVTLRATHRRLAWIPELVNLTRTEEPLRHQRTGELWPSGTAALADRLERAAVPYSVSVAKARALLKEAEPDIPIGRQNVLAAALKLRRERAGNGPGNALAENTGKRAPVIPVTDPSEQPVTVPVTVGNGIPGQPGNGGRYPTGNAHVPSPRPGTKRTPNLSAWEPGGEDF